jgi:hypothetical protein
VWLGFVYCELFRLQLPFSDQFQAILLGFIRFRYTGIYRSLSVSDFPFTDSDRTKNYAGENGERFFLTVTDCFHP